MGFVTECAFSRTDVRVKVSKFWRQSPEGGSSSHPSDTCRIYYFSYNWSYQGQTCAVPCFWNTGSGGMDIFVVNFTFEMLIDRGQQHSFSTHNNVAFKAVSASCVGTVSWNLQLLMLPTTMDWFYCWETSTFWPLEPHKSLWINHCMIERVPYMWELKCWFDVFDRYKHCMHPWNTWYRETNNIILPHTITHILKHTQSKTKQK